MQTRRRGKSELKTSPLTTIDRECFIDCNIIVPVVDIFLISSIITINSFEYLGFSRRYGKGVLKENDNISVHVIYYKEGKKTGFGVRKDHLIHYHLQDRPTMLMYSKPCLCGSLTHRTTRDSKCLLNVKYADAVEE